MAATDFSHVKGLFTDRYVDRATSILMPKTDRTLSGSALLPWIPGVYDVTYGFTNEKGQATTAVARVIYAPLWFIIAIGLVLLAAVVVLRKYWSSQLVS